MAWTVGNTSQRAAFGFDPARYLQANQDVMGAVPVGMDPRDFAVQHYQNFGQFENRASQPISDGQDWDAEYYGQQFIAPTMGYGGYGVPSPMGGVPATGNAPSAPGGFTEADLARAIQQLYAPQVASSPNTMQQGLQSAVADQSMGGYATGTDGVNSAPGGFEGLGFGSSLSGSGLGIPGTGGWGGMVGGLAGGLVGMGGGLIGGAIGNAVDAARANAALAEMGVIGSVNPGSAMLSGATFGLLGRSTPDQVNDLAVGMYDPSRPGGAGWGPFDGGEGGMGSGSNPSQSEMSSSAEMGGMDGTASFANGGRIMADGGSVPEGAYVIPADVVSAMGDGSTMAGHGVLSRFGGALVRGQGNGRSDNVMTRGPSGAIALSDGEVVIPPDGVDRAGGPGALERLVMQTRKQYQKKLGAIPRPAR